MRLSTTGRSRDSSCGAVTMLQPGQPMNFGFISVQGEKLFFPVKCPD